MFIRNNNFLKEYIKLSEYSNMQRREGQGPANVISLKSELKRHVSNLFKGNGPKVAGLYNQMKKDLDERIVKTRKTQEKDELELLKEYLNKYVKETFTKRDIWKNIINRIKKQTKHDERGDKEKTFLVYDGKTLQRWRIDHSNKNIQIETETINEVTFSELKRKEIHIVRNDNLGDVESFCKQLKNIFKQSEKKSIHHEIEAINNFWIGYNGSHDKNLLIDTDKLVEKTRDFYDNYFKFMFERDSIQNNDHVMILQLWLLYIVRPQPVSTKPFSNESLQKYLNKMRDQKSDIILNNNKIEEFETILTKIKKQSYDDIKPKEKYKDLIDEWRKVLPEKNPFVGKSTNLDTEKGLATLQLQ